MAQLCILESQVTPPPPFPGIGFRVRILTLIVFYVAIAIEVNALPCFEMILIYFQHVAKEMNTKKFLIIAFIFPHYFGCLLEFGLLMSFVDVYFTHNAAPTGIALCSTSIDFVTVLRHWYLELGLFI